MRKSGVLLPISSIPSDYGIGGFSKEAYQFVDCVSKSGMQYWQILPLGPTGYGDSPYQSFSTFAGNPYYIDLETLIEEGLLTKAECDAADYGNNSSYVDYEKLYTSRFALLRLAYGRSSHKCTAGYIRFIEENADWLDDYALFMAVKNYFNGAGWNEWEDDIRLRKPEAVTEYSEKCADEVDFYRFQQYLFSIQWNKLKAYANKNNVKIIGDIPIYVAFDSADAWSSPKLFLFDENSTPIEVAGCPPDAFTAEGQLWGNPLYDWDYHRSTGFEWWLRRLKHCFKRYDVVRLDHFRGFDAFYAIPYGAANAINGRWRQGPGYELFSIIKEQLGDADIIAEDLGFLTESVIELVKRTGYPGMKVLQFAFDPREPGNYLPHFYDENCVVYTGTHDNETTNGWYQGLDRDTKTFAMEYMGNTLTTPEHISWDFIRLALSSVAKLAIIPMQDFLELGNEARLNTPSTFGENWKWRMLKNEFTDILIERIYRLNWIYSRL